MPSATSAARVTRPRIVRALRACLLPMLLVLVLAPPFARRAEAFPPQTGLYVTVPLTLTWSGTDSAGHPILHGDATVEVYAGRGLFVSDVTIVVRPVWGTNAGGPYYDLGHTGPLTLTASTPYHLIGQRAFAPSDPHGRWYGYITFNWGGPWEDDETDVPFIFNGHLGR